MNTLQTSNGIILDPQFLHQKSEPATDFKDTLQKLCDIFPSDIAIGLSAVQIGILERIFIAKIGGELHAFINPSLQLSKIKVPSVEGCLSLPGVERCVERSHKAHVIGAIFSLKNRDKLIDDMELEWKDAFVVQHEMDHLNGILIVDLPEVKSQLRKENEIRTARRVKSKQRKNKKKNNNKSERVSAKREAKIRRNDRQLKKKRRRQAEILAEIEAKKENILP